MCIFCSKFVVNLPVKKQTLSVWKKLQEYENQGAEAKVKEDYLEEMIA